jgi:uncharacterized UBP type Zn finger protein
MHVLELRIFFFLISHAELSVLEANKRLLKELEDMGFPRIQAAKALHCSGTFFEYTVGISMRA